MFEKQKVDLETNSENNEAVASIYLGACDAIAELEAIKKRALQFLERNLNERGEVWGECKVATFGITEPKPGIKLDDKKWKDAVASSIELTNLETEYFKAQMPFMIDGTQDPRPFIRRKRSGNE